MSPAQRRRAIFALRLLLSLIALFLIWTVVAGAVANTSIVGYDARAYWGYPRTPLYDGPGEAAGYGIYRYSPIFVPLMTLWSVIPWPVFVALWITAMLALYVWLAGPWWLALLAFAPFLLELRMANIHILLALAVVLGFRWPAAWSFVLLTKVTPGVGLLWFAVRREWRSLTIAIAATAGLVAVGLLIAPDLWVEWIRSLAGTSQPAVVLAIDVPLLPRIALAALLVTWGALTDRRWTVVVAATLALPVLWFHGLGMLVGIAALQRGYPERIGRPVRHIHAPDAGQTSGGERQPVSA